MKKETESHIDRLSLTENAEHAKMRSYLKLMPSATSQRTTAMQSNTKYDPDVHSNIPSNYRAQMKKLNLDNGNNIITDEEIFNIWRDHYADDYEEEGYEDYDDYVLRLIECHIQAAISDK